MFALNKGNSRRAIDKRRTNWTLGLLMVGVSVLSLLAVPGAHATPTTGPSLAPAGPFQPLTPNTWVQCTTNACSSPNAPHGRASPGMAWEGGYDYLFGGYNASTVFSDTWQWIGTGIGQGTWTQLTSATHPSLRYGVQMAGQGTYGILFSGERHYTYLDSDTWYLSGGGSWTNLTGSHLVCHSLGGGSSCPSARTAGVFVYDSNDGYFVLNGGWLAPHSYATDTWKFVYYSGNSTGIWSELSSSGGPSGRGNAASGYDPSDNEVVVFGGQKCVVGNCTLYGDTCTFKGGSWSACSTLSGSPLIREVGNQMTFDNILGSAGYGAVLFGGTDYAGKVLQDTWNFSFGGWHQLSPSGLPPARAYGFMVYDSSGRTVQLVLYGGYDGTIYRWDTWGYIV